MILFGNKNRPFHWGPYPLERLPKDRAMGTVEAEQPRIARPEGAPSAPFLPFDKAVSHYHNVFRKVNEGKPAPAKAPVPDDLARRSQDIKGAGYFLDANMVGICPMPDSAWYEGIDAAAHSHAIVVMIDHGRVPEADNLAAKWTADCQPRISGLRAYEIAVALAEHIRAMGFDADVHDRDTGKVDADRLTVLSGLGIRKNDSTVVSPYLGSAYETAVVTTEYELATDTPLSPDAVHAKGLDYWLGIGGAVPGIERRRRNKRPTHMGPFPMEEVKRVDRPTTLIIDEEVPQVPKRAEFFERAVNGDLGDKAKTERTRFAFKHPFAKSMVSLIRSMVPEQDGTIAETLSADSSDAEANTKAIKSLSYLLGSEVTGICEIPDYAWYSHRKDGSEVPYKHKYAIGMIIDQGFDTMEGASGDDYISGAQSMRAYMRGAEIAGVLGEMIRSLGHGARSQTNADSDVLHLPVLLWAGLGELSRIGEVVLNPFIGPRLKSVVLTTDIPLVADKPVDFGLQQFCSNCWKCARECPCDAIAWGDKVVFNGYEMWKPDVERCARYRVTNPKGLACGRCMKTCPLNKVVTWEGPATTRIASWFGIHAMWAKPYLIPFAVWADDALGHGVRNPLKKWWLDLEIIDGVCVEPPKGANMRDLDLSRKLDASKQKMAYYPANRMPPPNALFPVPVDRKQGMKDRDLLETVSMAKARVAGGMPKPVHYIPTPPINDEEAAAQKRDDANPMWYQSG